MTAAEVMALARDVGLELVPLDGGGLLVRPKAVLTDELRAALSQHKVRLVAILRLREIHMAMGFSPEDVALIERVYLDPNDNREIVIAVRGPDGVVV